MLTHLVAKTLVFDQSGKLLLLKRSSTDEHRPGGWDLPGGRIEDHEDIVTGAVREALEEAGLLLDPANMQLIFAATNAGFNTSYKQNISLIRLNYAVAVTNPAVALSDEHDDFMWCTIHEALELMTTPHYQALFKHIIDNQIVADLWQASI